MRSTDLPKLKSLKKQIQSISNMTISDLKSIAEGLKPNDKLTQDIVFLLYKKYGWCAVNEYIETFAPPKVKNTNTLKEWLISTYNKIKYLNNKPK